jgi:2'-5' RNA ligase
MKNRGEGHITVISPVEYSKVLKNKISMEEINQIALAHRIQSSRFKIVCLGKGTVKKMETYFLVLESQDLIHLREEIYEQFVKNGGDMKAFDPHLFYPHITLGFTDQDLHFEQGVVKDRRSCIADINIIR